MLETKLHETIRVKRSTNSAIALLMMHGALSRIIETVISKGSNPATRRAMITSSLIQTFRRACEEEELLPMEQVQLSREQIHLSMELGQLPLLRQPLQMEA